MKIIFANLILKKNLVRCYQFTVILILIDSLILMKYNFLLPTSAARYFDHINSFLFDEVNFVQS